MVPATPEKEGEGHKTSCVDGKTKETEKIVLVDRKQNRGHKHLIRLAYRFLDQLHFEKIFLGSIADRKTLARIEDGTSEHIFQNIVFTISFRSIVELYSIRVQHVLTNKPEAVRNDRRHELTPLYAYIDHTHTSVSYTHLTLPTICSV